MLVAAAQAAGHATVPLPGASSVLAALSVAGDTAASGFAFIGFLPAKAGERDTALAALAERGAESLVLFEAPHRIAALLGALAAAMPERRLTLCRELTKQFETVATMSAATAPAWLAADANRARGEFVLVLHAMPAVAGSAGRARCGERAHLAPATGRAAAEAGGGACSHADRRAAQPALCAGPGLA